MMVTDVMLEEWKRLAEAASPGPWSSDDGNIREAVARSILRRLADAVPLLVDEVQKLLIDNAILEGAAIARRAELEEVKEERDRYKAVLFAQAKTALGPHDMDAPGGPVCACGKPSRHESGWCGEC